MPPTDIRDFYLLIPCYNNQKGLIRSLQSIDYPYHLFTVIVTDDGSSEPVSAENLRQEVSSELSVQVIRLEKNAGITKALNTGLDAIYSLSKQGLIARLDCSDLCAPGRFQQQVAFLKNNPEIHLSGTWCYFKNFHTGENYKYQTPTTHAGILKSMHFRNLFIHPTVMWRFSSSEQLYYPENFPHAEDYGLFSELLTRGKGGILPEFLVTCEINPKGISLANRKEQYKSRMLVVQTYGKSGWRKALGVFKLRLLMLIPGKLLLTIKKALYS